MDIKQIVDSHFQETPIAGQLSKETVKKIIEKIVDDYVKLKPATLDKEMTYIMNAGTLICIVYGKAREMGIDVTKFEISEEMIKAFAKHALHNN